MSMTLIGKSDESMTKSALSVIKRAIKEHEKDAQALHIIIASIIRTKQDWKTIIQVVREPDQDIIQKPAIIFCHLPRQYNDLYDDLLDVKDIDHINVIDDESIWDNLTAYLLDIIFYQAVHFRPLKAVSKSDGGYLKETKKTDVPEHNMDELMDIFNVDQNYDTQVNGYHYNPKFQTNMNGLRAHQMESNYDLFKRTGINLDRRLSKK